MRIGRPIAAWLFAGALLTAPLLAAAASSSCSPPEGATSRLVCRSPELRALDAELGRLFDAIEVEAHGIDAGSGRIVDPFGTEHRHWLLHTRNRCRTEGCLRRAYRARIADVKQRWADAL